MRKRLGALLATLCAAVLALACATPALATDPTFTLSITSETEGHTYQAYQIFAGDLSTDGDKVLSNVTWGTGVDATKVEGFVTALKADATIGQHFSGVTYDASDPGASAAAIAKVLTDTATFPSNAESLDTFAQLVSDSNLLSSTPSGTTSSGAQSGASWAYTIDNLPAGYYLVRDADGSPTGGADAKTAFILSVVGDTQVSAKADQPTIDKGIVTDGGTSETTNAAIGDEVTFQLTSAVPNMKGYNKYYFVVNDTLSKGLTLDDGFGADDVTVKIGDTALGTDAYTVTVTPNGADGTTSLKIVLKDFILYKNQVGSAITITYKATVDTDAVIGTAGNPNSVNLTFSNDPNYTYTGDNEPGGGEPTGTTPDHTTYTYVTGIKLTKQDGETKTALTNAEFKIEGTRLNTVIVTGNRFVEAGPDEQATHYELTDGSFTTEAPTEGTSDFYVSQTPTHVLETDPQTIVKAEQVEYTGWVNDQGILTFDGLAEGTYTITEVTAPSGYNLLEAPIELTITCTEPTDLTQGTACTWRATATLDGQPLTVDASTGVISFTVANFTGATLPSTGGMGTTVLYVVGGLLVAGAAIAYVVRRRMSIQQ